MYKNTRISILLIAFTFLMVNCTKNKDQAQNSPSTTPTETTPTETKPDNTGEVGSKASPGAETAFNKLLDGMTNGTGTPYSSHVVFLSPQDGTNTNFNFEYINPEAYGINASQNGTIQSKPAHNVGMCSKEKSIKFKDFINFTQADASTMVPVTLDSNYTQQGSFCSNVVNSLFVTNDGNQIAFTKPTYDIITKATDCYFAVNLGTKIKQFSLLFNLPIYKLKANDDQGAQIAAAPDVAPDPDADCDKNMAKNGIGSFNEITDLSFVSGLIAVTNLDLQNTSITNIQENTFSGLKNLENLNLSKSSKIAEIKDYNFMGLRGLKNLDLSKNQGINNKGIQFGNFAFMGLTSLEFLNLTENNLTSIPLALYNLKGHEMGAIDLCNNGNLNLGNFVFDGFKINELKLNKFNPNSLNIKPFAGMQPSPSIKNNYIGYLQTGYVTLQFIDSETFNNDASIPTSAIDTTDCPTNYVSCNDYTSCSISNYILRDNSGDLKRFTCLKKTN